MWATLAHLQLMQHPWRTKCIIARFTKIMFFTQRKITWQPKVGIWYADMQSNSFLCEGFPCMSNIKNIATWKYE
jgi:hypothetical protein